MLTEDQLNDMGSCFDMTIAAYQKAFRIFLKEANGVPENAIAMTNGWFSTIMCGAAAYKLNNKDDLEDLL